MLLFGIGLATAACGPPLPEDGGDDGDIGDETTDSQQTPADLPATSSTTTTTTESTSEATDFVPDGDLGGPASCDPFEQGCPDGEKCVPYASTGGTWDDHKCVPVIGEQATGEPCISGGVVEAIDDCDATGFCWNTIEVDGELTGTCHAFCLGSPEDPMCPPDSKCLISGNSTISLCIRSCDPLIQDCHPGQACYWDNDGFSCIPTTHDFPAGAPCGFVNDCAAGLICVFAEVVPDCVGPSCCVPFCELDGGDGPCAVVPQTTCTPMFEAEPPDGYENVGVCVSDMP